LTKPEDHGFITGRSVIQILETQTFSCTLAADDENAKADPDGYATECGERSLKHVEANERPTTSAIRIRGAIAHVRKISDRLSGFPD
jgi:hypothetical protein